jgi:hypothetical protein
MKLARIFMVTGILTILSACGSKAEHPAQASAQKSVVDARGRVKTGQMFADQAVGAKCVNFTGTYKATCSGNAVGAGGPNQITVTQTGCSELSFGDEKMVVVLQDLPTEHPVPGSDEITDAKYITSWNRMVDKDGRYLTVDFVGGAAGVEFHIDYSFNALIPDSKIIKRITYRGVPALGSTKEELEVCVFEPIQ